MNSKLTVTIAVIYAVIQVLLTLSIVALQVDAISQRKVSSGERQTLKRQNDLVLCVLEVQPQDRTPATTKMCREMTGN